MKNDGKYLMLNEMRFENRENYHIYYVIRITCIFICISFYFSLGETFHNATKKMNINSNMCLKMSHFPDFLSIVA